MRRRRTGCGSTPSAQRQVHRDHRATERAPVAGLDRSPVAGRDRADDRQPQARSGPSAGPRLVAPDEPLEHRVQDLGREPRAVVHDLEHRGCPAGAGAHLHRARAGGRAVVQEVAQELPEPVGVPRDDDGLTRHADADPERRLQTVGLGPGQGKQVDRFHPEDERAGALAGQQEQVLDQPGESLGLAERGPQRPFLLRTVVGRQQRQFELAAQDGDPVVAIGDALALPGGPTVTEGIVSALDRTIQTNAGATLQHVVQTDAAINPGNSGGPLVDATGHVVGIDTAAAGDGQDIGFAISIDGAQHAIDGLLAGAENG